MKKASDFDDKENLGHPLNQVYAIVPSHLSLDAIVGDLEARGFSTTDIGVLRGKQDAIKLEEATGEKGIPAKIFRMGLAFGDRDSTYLTSYRTALLQGDAVIGVVVHNENEREKVRESLKSKGARFLVYFGRFTAEVLEA
jgi:hypothetical protein